MKSVNFLIRNKEKLITFFSAMAGVKRKQKGPTTEKKVNLIFLSNK
jgi:hypothetical protein